MYVEAPCSWVRIVTEETMTISVLAYNFLNGPLTQRKIVRRHVLSEVGVDTSADTIRKWEVSNYFFWEGSRVVAPETCLGGR